MGNLLEMHVIITMVVAFAFYVVFKQRKRKEREAEEMVNVKPEKKKFAPRNKSKKVRKKP